MAQQSTRGGLTVCLVLLLVLASFGADLAAQPTNDLDALDSQISDLQRAGKHAEALPLAQRLVEESKTRFGDASAEYGAALDRLASSYFYQNRYDDAEPIYKLALSVREKALGPSHADVLETLAMLANVYRSSRRPQLAEPLLRRVLAEQERVGNVDPADVTATLTALAEVETALRRHDEAEAHVRRALALAGNSGPVETAQLLRVLALVQRNRGLLADALATLERALKLHEEVARSGQADDLAQAAHMSALAQMGLLSQQMNRFDIAAKISEQLLAISEKMLGPDHPTVASALEAVASAYEGEGRLAQAEPLRKRAVAINERAYGAEHASVASSLQGLGNLYGLERRDDEARPLLERALAIAEKALGPENPGLSEYLISLGDFHWARRRYAEAEPLMRRALANLDKAQGLDPVIAGFATVRILKSLAFLYEAQNRPSDANQFLERGLATAERVFGANHSMTGVMLSALAVHALAENRLDDAKQFFGRALPIAETGGRDSRAYADNLAGLSLVAFKREQWAEAYRAMTQASPIYVGLEQRAGGGQGATADAGGGSLAEDDFFMAQAVTAYHLAETDASSANRLMDEAFLVAQRAQSSRAAAALGQMAARFASGQGSLASLVRERQDLAAEARTLDAQLSMALSAPPEQRDSAAEGTFRDRQAEIARRLDAIDARLAKDFPGYAALANPQPLSIEAVQKLLAPSEALILVASRPIESLVWVVGSDAARWLLVPLGGEQLAREVGALRCGLDSSAWNGDGAETCRSLLNVSRRPRDPLPFDLARAHELYRAMLAPFADMIEGRRLLVAASGPLAALPLSVLVTDKPAEAIPADPARYKDAAWLLKRHAVTNLPSVESLGALRAAAKASRAEDPFIGFGNPLLAGRDGRDRRAWERQACPKAGSSEGVEVAGLAPPDELGKLFRGNLGNAEALRRQAPLPETADELCAVARALGAGENDVYLGARATESAVKALDRSAGLATHRVVHFATHGLLAGETAIFGTGAEPSLLLTPPEAPSEEDDGLLTASEVAQLKLDADWVVLSACNTAGGETGDAETLSGLARAFFYAGARALLVSHWYVDSRAAVKITTGAFAELKRDPAIGRAEALRRAMLAAMTDPSRPAKWTPAVHPAVWAPFAVVGEGGAGERRRSFAPISGFELGDVARGAHAGRAR